MFIYIKSVLAKILGSFNITSIYISKKSISNYLILMYHRIIQNKETEPGIQEGMYVESETFKMHIWFLKQYFKIIPLSEIYLYKNNRSFIKNYPICVITFDDGWYDFYKFAYPILVAQGIPATVFLPTKYIGTENRFWTDQVSNIFVQRNNQNIFLNKKTISKNIVINKLLSLEGKTNYKIESAISILKRYRVEEVMDILAELKNIWCIDEIISERAFLNWKEISKMAESGLITFGSHTNNHKILTYLNHDDIFQELIESKSRLLSEGVVNKSFIPFCYPNGNYDNVVIKIVEEAGYSVAVTTDRGWNNANTPRFTLKRVGIHQDISSTKELFGCRIANMF